MSTRKPPPPAAPDPCHFCGAPSVRVMGIRPVCAQCAPVAEVVRERNLQAMLAFFRDLTTRDMKEDAA